MPDHLFEVTDLSIVITRVDSASRRDPITHKVIDNVSFSVDEGEALALVGESGSGKSLIAMGAIDLMGAGAVVTTGTTTFEGKVLQDLDDADWLETIGLGIGVLLQDAIGSWDPLDFMGFQSGETLTAYTDLTQDEVAERVSEALGEVGLHKRRFLSTFSHEVSRGQAQRAMLAATLLSAPRMLIADEPLSGLDVTTARAVLELITDMRRRRGMGMLFVTHDLAVVAAVADRVAVVYGGAIVEEAAVSDLYHHPQHPYTSGLLGSIPSLTTSRLRPIEGEAPAIWDLPAGCSFAPRCPFAVDRCHDEKPLPRPVGGSIVACHRSEELELTGVG